MRCTQVRCYVSPYLDSELDAKTTFEISRHLEICPACARLFSQEGELDRAIFERIKLPEGDENVVLERALGRTLSSRGLTPRGWLWTAAALLLVLAVWATWRGSSHPQAPALVELVAGDHQKYLRGEAPFECASSEAHEVGAFLAENLEQPACALPAGESWELQGARICSFEGTRIGLVTLCYQGIPISVGDLPARGGPLPDDALAAADTGHCFELLGGRGMVGRTSCGLRVAFGDVEVARLAEVIASAGLDQPSESKIK